MTGVWQDALSYILTSPPDHQPGSVQSPGQVRAESYPPLLEGNLTPHSQMYINNYEEKRRRNSGCEVMAVGERSGGGAGPGISIVQQSGQPGWRK